MRGQPLHQQHYQSYIQMYLFFRLKEQLSMQRCQQSFRNCRLSFMQYGSKPYQPNCNEDYWGYLNYVISQLIGYYCFLEHQLLQCVLCLQCNDHQYGSRYYLQRYLQQISSPQRANFILSMAKSNYIMPKRSQTLYRQLSQIINRSLDFQRYFALIKLLNIKKQQAESQMPLLQKLLQQAKAEQDQQVLQRVAYRILKAQRTIYGLSKEKIQVCRQLSDCIDTLRAEFHAMLKRHQRTQIIQKMEQTFSGESPSLQYSELSPGKNTFVNKAKEKQRKLTKFLLKMNSPTKTTTDSIDERTNNDPSKNDQFRHIFKREQINPE